MQSILVVILNWNDIDSTEKCISSLLNQETTSCDILVIDNGSVKDPTITLKTKFRTIFVIREKQNLGVAGGRNIGINYAIKNGYEFVLLFDNDAYAHKNMVRDLYESARRNESTGVFGPKILRDDKKNIIWRAGCTSWKWTYLHAGHSIVKRIFELINVSTPRILDTIRGENKIDNGKYDQEEPIVFQIGCAQLIRTKLFKEIGLLDEDFSPYGSEDIDFCARVNRSGWEIRYVPAAVCWHNVSSSFGDDYYRTFYNLKNVILLARKNLSFLYFWLLFVPDLICLHLPLIIIENIFKKKREGNRAIVDAIHWTFNDILNRGVLISNAAKKKK